LGTFHLEGGSRLPNDLSFLDEVFEAAMFWLDIDNEQRHHSLGDRTPSEARGGAQQSQNRSWSVNGRSDCYRIVIRERLLDNMA